MAPTPLQLLAHTQMETTLLSGGLWIAEQRGSGDDDLQGQAAARAIWRARNLRRVRHLKGRPVPGRRVQGGAEYAVRSPSGVPGSDRGAGRLGPLRVEPGRVDRGD